MRFFPAFLLIFFLLPGLTIAGREPANNTDTHETEDIFDFLNLSSVDSGISTSHNYKPEINTTVEYIQISDIEEKELINPITFLFSGVVGIFLLGTYKILAVIL